MIEELDTGAAASMMSSVAKDNCSLIWSKKPHQWSSQLTLVNFSFVLGKLIVDVKHGKQHKLYVV